MLQDSLRPPSLPDIDGAQLAARYRPAAEHLDIGGDFYDVHGRDGRLAALPRRRLRQGRGGGRADRPGPAKHPHRLLFRSSTGSRAGRAEHACCIDEAHEGLRHRGVRRMRRDADGRPAARRRRRPATRHRSCCARDGRVETARVGGTAVGMVAQVRLPAGHGRASSRGDTMLMFTDGSRRGHGRRRPVRRRPAAWRCCPAMPAPAPKCSARPSSRTSSNTSTVAATTTSRCSR